jgi:hypothetical protein
MEFIRDGRTRHIKTGRYRSFVPRKDVMGKVIIIWASDDEARIGDVK